MQIYLLFFLVNSFGLLVFSESRLVWRWDLRLKLLSHWQCVCMYVYSIFAYKWCVNNQIGLSHCINTQWLIVNPLHTAYNTLYMSQYSSLCFHLISLNQLCQICTRFIMEVSSPHQRSLFSYEYMRVCKLAKRAQGLITAFISLYNFSTEYFYLWSVMNFVFI